MTERTNGRAVKGRPRNGTAGHSPAATSAARELERDERAVTQAKPPGVSSGVADRFRDIADRITRAVGSPIALMSAIFLILLWAVTGPIFGFSDSWQLLINTTTTIITFLMVFVIQTSQNRDGRAIQLKLDELIRSHSGARNELMATEKGPEEALTALEEEFDLEAKAETRRRRPRATATRPSSPRRSSSRSSNRSTTRSRRD